MNLTAKKNNEYDIIFSSGTIQYFEKPYEIIEEIFSSGTKFIGFTRINFSNNPKIYSQPTLIEYHGAREGSLDFKYKKSKKIIIPNTQINENEMLKISNGARTVPQIFIEDYHVGGNRELQALERQGKLDNLLKN